MDAFEQVVAEVFWAEGWWVHTSVKVELTKEDKARIERQSSPRWELDVVAYDPGANELRVIECKSFLDSTGVRFAELQDGHASKRYKLFREPILREVVLGRLAHQFTNERRCRADPAVTLGMAAGKIRNGDEARLAAHFADRGWLFFGPAWLRVKLQDAAQQGYQNQVSSIVAKLLLREPAAAQKESSRGRCGLDPATPLKLLVSDNPKRPGTEAHERFRGYFRPEANTIATALACGLRMDDIRHDVEHGFIALGAAADD
jgi:hypothetical protein